VEEEGDGWGGLGWLSRGRGCWVVPDIPSVLDELLSGVWKVEMSGVIESMDIRQNTRTEPGSGLVRESIEPSMDRQILKVVSIY